MVGVGVGDESQQCCSLVGDFVCWPRGGLIRSEPEVTQSKGNP